MGKLSLKDKVCILTSWALMLMSGAAEQDYFPQAMSLTWEEARSHCQVCFEDLVTLTSENTQSIAVNLTSDHWVGLRKNPNPTSNSTMFWSRWANGDPLAFQNWYPGWPVLKRPSPEPVCCSCSCTCPSSTVYSSTFSAVTSSMSSTFGGISTASQVVTGQAVIDQVATGRAVIDLTATDQVATGQVATGQMATDLTATDQVATGQAATDQVATGQAATDQVATGQMATGQMATGQAATDQMATGQMVTGPAATGPAAAGQVVTGPTATGPAAAGQVVTGPTATGPAAAGQAVTGPTATGPTATGPTATGPTAAGPTAAGSTAAGPIVAECVRTPMLSPNVSKTDQKYIEDSCVAMLSFGAWVERNCSESLPFICYEVRFIGKVNASDVTTRSAIVTWERGPGNISHYRLEVRGDTDWKENQIGLTTMFVNLTAGTQYSVKVFPVKCRRDLNPQTVVFYTIPNKVENLKADNQTESSVTLSWDKPDGKVDSYIVKVNGQRKQSVRAKSTVVEGLTSGNPHTFSVLSAVNDETVMSEESNVTDYTKPGTVSNLMVCDNSNTSLKLSWTAPSGGYSDFRVIAMNGNNTVFFNKTETRTEFSVTNLPVGSNITLSVTARANHSLEGDSVFIIGYTTPGPISDLNLVSTNDRITATWNFPEGSFSSFKIILQLDGKDVQELETRIPAANLTGLKNAAEYTVIVRISNRELEGPPVSKSTHTLPAPPTNLKVTFSNHTHITFKWDPPVNASTKVMYSVKLRSDFWGHFFSKKVPKETYTFAELKSGTKYDFEVQTVVGTLSSPVEKLSQCTEAKKREISLAMLCSSAEVLLCDNATTRNSVFDQLKSHFEKKLGNDIFWELLKPN
ncbi:receptor-type tyrosine-protein phosphatase H [Acanthopagrus latus]|uniref:receptor-type tyrosine-protein phosphatase H n=1 Tax=Acanthopagrus latus TaxID=8177 RepID=UPI00187C4276|nr:receptor-type tyrosine-protein phosphatase H [Acanthopagrus latus]